VPEWHSKCVSLLINLPVSDMRRGVKYSSRIATEYRGKNRNVRGFRLFLGWRRKENVGCIIVARRRSIIRRVSPYTPPRCCSFSFSANNCIFRAFSSKEYFSAIGESAIPSMIPPLDALPSRFIDQAPFLFRFTARCECELCASAVWIVANNCQLRILHIVKGIIILNKIIM